MIANLPGYMAQAYDSLFDLGAWINGLKSIVTIFSEPTALDFKIVLLGLTAMMKTPATVMKWERQFESTTLIPIFCSYIYPVHCCINTPVLILLAE